MSMDAAAKQEANAELARMLGWTELWDNGQGDTIGIPPGKHHAGIVPDWYGSVDKCLAVLPEGEYAVLMYPPPVEGAQHSVRIVGLNGDATAHGATRAEALANARLAMAQAQQVQP